MILPAEPVVVDASVAIKWVLAEDDSATAHVLVQRRVRMAAPELLRVEAANALWKRVRGKDLTADEALACWDALLRVPMELHPLEGLAPRALEQAIATGGTVYDCLYLALAEDLGTCLVTSDERFRNAVQAVPGAPKVLLLAEAAVAPAQDDPENADA